MDTNAEVFESLKGRLVRLIFFKFGEERNIKCEIVSVSNSFLEVRTLKDTYLMSLDSVKEVIPLTENNGRDDHGR